MTAVFNVPESFVQAMDAADPSAALLDAIKVELDRSSDRDQVLAQLEGLRLKLQSEGRDSEDDIVLDNMDRIVGFCHSSLTL